MSENPLTSKVGMDVGDFRSGLAELNRGVRSIETGFRASAAALGDWSKSSQGLEDRIKALTEEIKVQEKAVAANENEYKRLADAYGVGSRAAQDQAIKTNLATERLNKMKNELGTSRTALQNLKPASEDAGKGIKQMGSDSDIAGRKMINLEGISNGLKTAIGGIGQIAKIGLSALAGLGVGALGAVAGLTKLILGTAKTADDLDELSQKTGISTTRLQELAFIGKQSGTDIDTMTGSMAKLVRSMDATKSYGAPAAQAFRTLGVSVRDAHGNLKDSEQVFYDTLNALGKVGDDTERDALSMEIFGKSAQELNPLILMGADGMKTMSDQAHTLGAVMSEEDVKAAADLNDKIDGLKMGFQGTANTILSAFIPAFSGVADTVGGYATIFAKAIGLNKDFPKVGQQMIVDLVRSIILQIPKLVDAGLSIVMGLITSITDNLPTLMSTGVTVITSLVTALTTAIPLLLSAGGQILMALINGILPMLPGLLQTGMDILTNILLGLTQALPQIIPAITDVVTKIAYIITTNGPALINAAIPLLVALAQGIGAALPTLTPAIVAMVSMIVLTLVQNLPLLITAAMQLMGALAQGIMQALPLLATMGLQILVALTNAIVISLPTILSAAFQIMQALDKGLRDAANVVLIPAAKAMTLTFSNAFQALIKSFQNIGTFMVQGIWQGIQSLGSWLEKKLGDWILSLIGSVTKANSGGSPFMKWAPVGVGMAQGIGVGFGVEIEKVRNQVARSLTGLTASGALGIDINGNGGVVSQVTDSSETYNFYAPVTLAGQSGDNLSATIKTKRY